ncbi:hypothetical protein J6590_080494 [Homalodisca vitripennis]|nr:hypothetical protein J6590_080494 [Homalodisca vitripennis]
MEDKHDATPPRGLAILSASLSGEGREYWTTKIDGYPDGYGLLGNKGATLLMGCDSRRSPTVSCPQFETGSTLMQLFRPSPIGRGSTMTLTELVRPPRGARWNK